MCKHDHKKIKKLRRKLFNADVRAGLLIDDIAKEYEENNNTVSRLSKDLNDARNALALSERVRAGGVCPPCAHNL
jgi:transposase